MLFPLWPMQLVTRGGGGLWGLEDSRRCNTNMIRHRSSTSKPYKQGTARGNVWLHSRTKGKRLCVNWSILVYRFGTCCNSMKSTYAKVSLWSHSRFHNNCTRGVRYTFTARTRLVKSSLYLGLYLMEATPFRSIKMHLPEISLDPWSIRVWIGMTCPRGIRSPTVNFFTLNTQVWLVSIRKLGRSWHDQTYLTNRCQHAINR